MRRPWGGGTGGAAASAASGALRQGQTRGPTRAPWRVGRERAGAKVGLPACYIWYPLTGLPRGRGLLERPRAAPGLPSPPRPSRSHRPILGPVRGALYTRVLGVGHRAEGCRSVRWGKGEVPVPQLGTQPGRVPSFVCKGSNSGAVLPLLLAGPDQLAYSTLAPTFLRSGPT
jgi:hypothetical protein